MKQWELGLLPILVSIISTESGRARETALAILAGTSIYSSNNKYMLSLNLAWSFSCISFATIIGLVIQY